MCVAVCVRRVGQGGSSPEADTAYWFTLFCCFWASRAILACLRGLGLLQPRTLGIGTWSVQAVARQKFPRARWLSMALDRRKAIAACD